MIGGKQCEQPITDIANTLMLIVWCSWQSPLNEKFCNSEMMNCKWTCAFYCLRRRAIFCEQVIHLALFSEWFCMSDGEEERWLGINGKHWVWKYPGCQRFFFLDKRRGEKRKGGKKNPLVARFSIFLRSVNECHLLLGTNLWRTLISLALQKTEIYKHWLHWVARLGRFNYLILNELCGSVLFHRLLGFSRKKD